MNIKDSNTEPTGLPEIAPPVHDSTWFADALASTGTVTPLDQPAASKAEPLPDRMAIKMLVAAGYVTEAKANEALNIAHGFDKGPLAAPVTAPPSAPVGVDAAEHWHDLYRKECRLRQDDAARYGQQIIGLESLAQQPAAPAVTANEREWMQYAIDHMRDDNEPEDATCANVLEALLARMESAPAAPGIDLSERVLSILIEEGVLGRNGRVFQKIRTLIDAGPKGGSHPDDLAVDALAAAMKAKLAEARAKGRSGWNGDEPGMQQRLSDMLRDHVDKGDPRDVANFCMFLHQRGEAISPKGGSTDAKDAARWRFLRDNNGVRNHLAVEVFIDGAAFGPGYLDAQVDEAMQATSGEVGS